MKSSPIEPGCLPLFPEQRFSDRVTPIQAGRNGEHFLLAPDVVNTVEHLDAQVRCMRENVMSQRDLLLAAVSRAEDRLLAAYELLYAGAPEAEAEVLAVHRHFEENGDICGGVIHVEQWIQGWMDRLSSRVS